MKYIRNHTVIHYVFTIHTIINDFDDFPLLLMNYLLASRFSAHFKSLYNMVGHSPIIAGL